MTKQSGDYINILNLLRAIAALGVCAVHIHYLIPDMTKNAILSKFFNFGQQGVSIFFVISGFIIPYSLWNSGYQTNNFFNYLLRRIVRIDPPYFFTILICIIFLGAKIDYNILILHLGYLIPLSNYEWYQSVFWTLGIEFQFYILIGILFPYIKDGNIYIVSFLLLLIAMVGYFLPYGEWKFIYRYIHYFCIGIMCCLFKQGRINIWLMHFFLFVITAYLCFRISYITGLVGYTTALTIMYIDIKTIVTDYLGKISYSLYLTHSLIAGLLVAQISPNIHNPYLLFALLAIACIIFASVFYYFIERPSIISSKKIALKW